MRFTEGVWYNREGVETVNAQEVGKLDTSVTSAPYYPLLGRASSPDELLLESVRPDQEAFIRAVCHIKEHKSRSDALNKPTITVQVDSPLEGIIRVEVTHFKGAMPLKEPRATLFPDPSHPPQSGASVSFGQDSVLGIKTATLAAPGGSLEAEMSLTANRFGIRFFGKGSDGEKELLTQVKTGSLSFSVVDQATPRSFGRQAATNAIVDPYYRPPAATRKGFMNAALNLAVGEKVYGLGERFGPFIRNGQTVELSAEDGGTSSDIAYKNVPFYITNRGYGVYYDHTDNISFEVQSDTMTKVQATVPGEKIRFYVISGPSPKDILSRYTYLTGRPPLPPDWSYGLWLSTSFLTSYDEVTVLKTIDEMKTRDIPLHVFHFDCFWMKAHEWCNFEFDPEFFPDPAGFLSKIHDRGVKVSLWINPYIAQESRLFKEGDENGYLLKRLDGRTYQSDDWQAGMAWVDFTNPDAVKWYQGYLRALIKLGVDAFKTDFGERIPAFDVKYFDGSDPHAMHNYYSYIYNKAVYEVVKEEKGADQAIVFARSGYTGSQTMPVHWGGDCDKEWTGMAESLRGGLSIGLAGFGYWSHDIGGFKREGRKPATFFDPEEAAIYKRWVQFGLLSSHSRLHGSETYRVPWLIDEEACTVLRKFTKLKNRLEPYLTTVSYTQAMAKGHSLLRAMLMEFPEDPTAWDLDQQYMLGSDLLVAPIFGDAKVQYYVPEGSWTNILTGAVVDGPRWHTEKHTMETLPLLLKPGSAVIVGKEGHDVAGNVLETGFTIIASSQLTGSTYAKASLRSGIELAVLVEAEVVEGSTKTFTFTLLPNAQGQLPEYKVDFDVVIVGDGVGLDNAETRTFRSSGGTASIELK